MPLRMTTTDQASSTHGVKVMVYGEAGVGKTVLCSTAPSPVIISAEAGLLSLKKFKIPVIEIKSIDDLTEAHKWCTQSQEATQFATVCIDSLSEIAEVVLSNAKAQVKDGRLAYGEMADKMAMVIRAFRDLAGKHVYMSAKQEAVKDNVGIIRFAPSTPGNKLGQSLPYYFDEVFCLRLNKTPQGDLYRFLQTQPDLQYVAKDRSGELTPAEPPDLDRVFRKILHMGA